MDPKKRTWLLGGLALVSGAGLVLAVERTRLAERPPAQGLGPKPPQPSPALPPRRNLVRVLLIGDSLAVGLNVPLQRLATDAGTSLRGRGKQSTTITDWDHGTVLSEELAAFRPSVVLFSIGTNDMKMFHPEGEAPALARILKTVRDAGAELVLILPPTMPFPDAGVRGMLAASGARGYPSTALTIQRGPDHIHPTALGYAGWSGALWTWLRTT